jgi:hypothetical protein
MSQNSRNASIEKLHSGATKAGNDVGTIVDVVLVFFAAKVVVIE